MNTEPGIMHAYICPHCHHVLTWEIGLHDERREWAAKCQTCGGDVAIRYNAKRDAVSAVVP